MTLPRMPGVDDFPVNLGREICFDSLTKDTVIQMTSAYQMSELHEALWYDNNSEAKQVVAAAKEDKSLKKLLRSEDRDGRSPLIYAVIRRNIPMVKLLIDEGAPVNYQNPDNGYTALVYACYYGFKEGVDMLLNGGAEVQVWTKGRKPVTPFLICCAKGYVQILVKLLEQGADLKDSYRVENENFNPLVLALHSEEIDNLPVRQAVCELLVTYDVNTFVQRSDGVTPLMIAMDRHMTDFAKMLVEKELARVDKIANDKCTTALWLAMRQSNQEMVDVLMKEDANIHTGLNRSTPLHAAVIAGFTYGVKLLLKNDHQPMPFDIAGFTPVHYAACLPETRCLKMILKKGVNIEVPAKRSHFTPLHVACLAGNIPGIKVLLRNGADIEAVDKKDGLTPLIATFQHNHVEATKFLIEKGANIMGRRFGKGMTPLVNAIGLQREEIRQLIIDKAREKPDMMGELKKQGGGHRSRAYKKRTFVLYGTYLSYYKTPLIQEPQGMIILDKAKIISGSKNNFQVVTPHRAYQIQAKSPEEKKEWVDALQKAVDSYNSEEAPPASAFTYEGKIPDMPKQVAPKSTVVKQTRPASAAPASKKK